MTVEPGSVAPPVAEETSGAYVEVVRNVAESMEKLAAALLATYRTVDPRDDGHERPAPPPGTLTRKVLVAHVARVIRELIDRFGSPRSPESIADFLSDRAVCGIDAQSRMAFVDVPRVARWLLGTDAPVNAREEAMRRVMSAPRIAVTPLLHAPRIEAPPIRITDATPMTRAERAFVEAMEAVDPGTAQEQEETARRDALIDSLPARIFVATVDKAGDRRGPTQVRVRLAGPQPNALGGGWLYRIERAVDGRRLWNGFPSYEMAEHDAYYVVLRHFGRILRWEEEPQSTTTPPENESTA